MSNLSFYKSSLSPLPKNEEVELAKQAAAGNKNEILAACNKVAGIQQISMKSINSEDISIFEIVDKPCCLFFAVGKINIIYES